MVGRMNDHALSLYVLPVNPESEWFYLYEAHDGQSLQAAIARRPIKERAYLTVYTNSKEWLTVGSYSGFEFKHAHITHHEISDTDAENIWRMAKTVFDNQNDFKADLLRIASAYFPEVKKHTPFYLQPVN